MYALFLPRLQGCRAEEVALAGSGRTRAGGEPTQESPEAAIAGSVSVRRSGEGSGRYVVKKVLGLAAPWPASTRRRRVNDRAHRLGRYALTVRL